MKLLRKVLVSPDDVLETQNEELGSPGDVLYASDEVLGSTG